MAKKILIVDDEPSLLKVWSIRLRMTGYEVFEASDGQQALDLARQLKPDLIILDVYLPTINGDEVAKILKHDEELKRVPIVLISATVNSINEKFKACGADGYFSKPFEAKELIDMVDKLLK